MDLPGLGAEMPPLGQVVAARELRFVHASGQEEPVHVSIGAPMLRDGTWWCPYEIRAASFTRCFALAGEDSLQALLASSSILASELGALARRHDGAFFHFDGTDLMLPSMDWLRRDGDQDAMAGRDS